MINLRISNYLIFRCNWRFSNLFWQSMVNFVSTHHPTKGIKSTNQNPISPAPLASRFCLLPSSSMPTSRFFLLRAYHRCRSSNLNSFLFFLMSPLSLTCLASTRVSTSLIRTMSIDFHLPSSLLLRYSSLRNMWRPTKIKFTYKRIPNPLPL